MAASSSQKETNPLKIGVVLEHLFELCPADVLATCRLVCKEWYDKSLLPWRKIVPLTFYAFGNNSTFLKYIQTPENQLSIKPYRTFHVEYCTFGANPEQFDVFWKVLGPQLTTLKLVGCTFSHADEFGKVVYNSFPNLKHLTLENCDFLFSDLSMPVVEGSSDSEYREPLWGQHKNLKSLVVHTESQQLPFSWVELLSHFQSLISLEFELNFRYTPETKFNMFSDLAKGIRAVRKQNKDNLKFETFSFCHPMQLSDEEFDLKQLAIIEELNFPIAVTAVTIRTHPNMNKEHVKNTLQCHKKTLQKIIVEEEVSSIVFSEFPFGLQLDGLHYLEVENRVCINLKFLKYTPNLKSLHISSEEQPGSAEIICQAVANTPKREMAHVKMMKLVNLDMDGILSDDDLASLFQWMPNVVNLRIVLNDSQFSSVCENWTRLSKLEVLGGEITDKGITGRGWTENEMMEGKKDEHILPNITFLKDLTSFKVWSLCLTDVSAFHGFFKLPNLQKISMYGLFHPEQKFVRWGSAAENEIKQRNIKVRMTRFIKRARCMCLSLNET